MWKSEMPPAQAAPFEEIKKDNILSVARSNDGTAVKAVLSDATVTGGVFLRWTTRR